MKITQFATDEKKEQAGVWVEVGEGASLLIARTGNDAYRKLFRKLTRPFEKQIRLGTIPDEKLDEIYVEVLARTILLDWKGLQDENGNAVAYSTDQAIAYLGDKRLKQFRELVQSLADDAEGFREDSIREDADALGNVSGGTSNGPRTPKLSPAQKVA